MSAIPTRLVEITLEHLTADRFNVASGARHSRRVDVHGVELRFIKYNGERRGDCAGSATKVDDDGPRPVNQGSCLVNKQLGAEARHEHTGPQSDAQAAELRPAKDVLERDARDTPIDQGGELSRRICRIDEQPCLFLGEDTAGRPESGYDFGFGAQSHGSRHSRPFATLYRDPRTLEDSTALANLWWSARLQAGPSGSSLRRLSPNSQKMAIMTESRDMA